jgi:hypothetical protein
VLFWLETDENAVLIALCNAMRTPHGRCVMLIFGLDENARVSPRARFAMRRAKKRGASPIARKGPEID